MRYKQIGEKIEERGDEESEGFEGGSREIGLEGQIKRKWKGEGGI